jgi:ElaB/YqjD/DUF883 family membrane-anchored ribosome-binding protein
MDQEPDVIRQQIDETRESLTEKLETVESLVKEKVSAVTEGVEKTIDTVKAKVEDTVQAVSNTVENTVHSVRRTFDVPHQVRCHPYAMTGGALALGATLGYLLLPRRHSFAHRSYEDRTPSYTPPPPPPSSFAEEPRHYEERRPERPSLLSGLLEPLTAEFDKVKATAIGALLGMVRDAALRSVPPSLASKVEEIVNDITRRAGGDVVSGPILPSSRGEPHDRG